jgi:hypothetical protein
MPIGEHACASLWRDGAEAGPHAGLPVNPVDRWDVLALSPLHRRIDVLIHSPRARTLVTALAGALVLFAGCTQTTASTAPSASWTLTPNYRLLIHCGIRYATFDKDAWEAVAPIPAIPDAVEEPEGVMHDRYEVAGFMERLSATEARFTTTEYPEGVVVHFVRSTATVPACA